jgi:hypothetical protein
MKHPKYHPSPYSKAQQYCQVNVFCEHYSASDKTSILVNYNNIFQIITNQTDQYLLYKYTDEISISFQFQNDYWKVHLCRKWYSWQQTISSGGKKKLHPRRNI